MRIAMPYIWLGPRWYAWLEFGPDSRHATFMAIGKRVAAELGGTFEEYLPNPSDDGKEYAKVVVGGTCLLLMRRAGMGSALGAECRDVPLLLRVALLYGAKRRGWRWPLYRLWRRVAGRRSMCQPGKADAYFRRHA